MKKLMVMLGAVAMAFGLFADATNYKTSFEVGEDGVSGDGKIYAPETAGWTGIEEDLTLGGYAGDAYTYPTDEVAGNTRRDDFPQKAAQANFLTLDTGTNSLDRAITKEAKDIFIDQLVKFTGFEDPQTNVVAGTKIAVWMGEFVTNETDNAEFTETNLYVTVGAEDVTGPVAVKILGNYELGKWYRLTIKSIGDIFGGQAATARSGFLVFVDGKPATIDTTAEGYVDLISQVGKLSGAAAAAYTANRLFPAITAGGEMLASVGYQGIGAIDDVYIDELGPEFARFVDVTFADITGATITKVVDSDGNEFTDFSKAISVKPGQLTVTLAAKPGWILKNATKTVDTKDAVSGEITITLTEEDAVEADVKLTRDSVDTYFTQEQFEAMLADVPPAVVVDGDVITVLKEIGKEDESFNKIYSFTPGTTITIEDVKEESTVVAVKWIVNIPDYDETEGGLVFKLGVAAEKQIEVGFTGELGIANGHAEFSGEIAEGAYFWLKNGDGEIYAKLMAEGAKVIAPTDTSVFDADVAEDLEKVKTDDEPSEGYTTITAAEPAPTTGFAIIITDATPAVTNYFDTLEEAIAAAGTEVKGVTLPNVVTIMDNVTIDSQIVIAKDVTIDFNDKTITSTWVSETGVANRGAFLVQGAYTATFKNGAYESVAIQAGALVTGGATLNVVNMDYTTVYRALYAKANGTIVVDADSNIIVSNIANANENAIMGFDGANITINGYVQAADNAAIIGSGNAGAAFNLTINDGATVKCLNGEAIYWPNAGTLTVNGGTIVGSTSAIYAKSGTVNIDGGTLTSTGSIVEPTVDNDGCKGSGYALILETGSEQGGYANSLSFSITGGKFTSEGAAVYNFVRTGAQPIAPGIENGLFKAKPDEALLVASTTPGYKAVWEEKDEGYFTPGEEEIEYTITFVTENPNTKAPDETNYTVNTKFPLTLEDATVNEGVTGITFAGWTNETIVAAIKAIPQCPNPLGDITLYAKWDVVVPASEGAKVAENLTGTPEEKTAAAEVIDEMCAKVPGTMAADVNTWLGTFTTKPVAAEIAAAKSLDVSYQLGATTLFTTDPVAEVVTFAQAVDADEGMVGYDLTFSVKNGAAGDAVTVAAKAADYVKTLVQANEKVDFGSDTALMPTITATPNGSTTVQVKVELPADKAAAFMKVATPVAAE